ncbi:hypothetical protein STRDD11_01187 [Streptococcus sp. DD11]|nr:hypothetical protein STRDD11_01187 [Streptococcus sp. DD11]
MSHNLPKKTFTIKKLKYLTTANFFLRQKEVKFSLRRLFMIYLREENF